MNWLGKLRADLWTYVYTYKWGVFASAASAPQVLRFLPGSGPGLWQWQYGPSSAAFGKWMSFKNLMKLKVMINTPTSDILSGKGSLARCFPGLQVFGNSPMMAMVGKLIFTSGRSRRRWTPLSARGSKIGWNEPTSQPKTEKQAIIYHFILLLRGCAWLELEACAHFLRNPEKTRAKQTWQATTLWFAGENFGDIFDFAVLVNLDINLISSCLAGKQLHAIKSILKFGSECAHNCSVKFESKTPFSYICLWTLPPACSTCFKFKTHFEGYVTAVYIYSELIEYLCLPRIISPLDPQKEGT